MTESDNLQFYKRNEIRGKGTTSKSCYDLSNSSSKSIWSATIHTISLHTILEFPHFSVLHAVFDPSGIDCEFETQAPISKNATNRVSTEFMCCEWSYIPD